MDKISLINQQSDYFCEEDSYYISLSFDVNSTNIVPALQSKLANRPHDWQPPCILFVKLNLLFILIRMQK